MTNQAGIGRGYYGWSEFGIVQDAILAALSAEGARIDAVYACPHHPNGQGTFLHADHPGRKPNPGMLLQAATDLSLDLGKSWLVGDKLSDIEAAERAGLEGALHVITGHGAAERQEIVTMAVRGAAFDLRFGCSIVNALDLPLFVCG